MDAIHSFTLDLSLKSVNDNLNENYYYRYILEEKKQWHSRRRGRQGSDLFVKGHKYTNTM